MDVGVERGQRGLARGQQGIRGREVARAQGVGGAAIRRRKITLRDGVERQRAAVNQVHEGSGNGRRLRLARHQLRQHAIVGGGHGHEAGSFCVSWQVPVAAQPQRIADQGSHDGSGSTILNHGRRFTEFVVCWVTR
jgi:hypothetical protein